MNLLIVFAVMFGIFLVLMQFLQAVLGYSALRAAAGLLPMALVMMPLSSIAPTIAKRFGTAACCSPAPACSAPASSLLATMVSAEGGYWSVLPGLLVFGAGVGLLMSPSTAAITESLPAEKQGVASALNDTVRELGGAIGIALLGSLVNSGYRSSVSSATATLSPELAHQVEDGIGSAFAAAPQLGADARPCSTPLVTHSSTAGACRCGSVSASPPWPSSTWSSRGPRQRSTSRAERRAGLPAAIRLVDRRDRTPCQTIQAIRNRKPSTPKTSIRTNAISSSHGNVITAWRAPGRLRRSAAVSEA